MVVRVKVGNDYSVAWPVWRDDGPADEGDFPIPPELAGALRAWAQSFNDHFEWDTGWDEPSSARPHAEEGRRIQAALQEALGPEYVVDLDLWEA